jgi:hypothetical protein
MQMEWMKAQLGTFEQHVLVALAKGSASVWIAGGTLALALFGASAVNASTVHPNGITPVQSSVTSQHHCPYEGDGYGVYSGYGN